MCDGTLAHGPGTIEVAGAIPFEQGGIHLAVRGTGKYRDAAGTLTVRNAPGAGDRLIVRLVN